MKKNRTEIISCVAYFRTEDSKPRIQLGPIMIFFWGGASHYRGSILAPYPAAAGLILGVTQKFSLDFAEIY